MKLEEVRDVLQAIRDGHVYWQSSGYGYDYFRLDGPVEVGEAETFVLQPSAMTARSHGQQLTVMQRMSERFFHRDGWEDGEASGKVSLTYAGEKELDELAGVKRRSVWG